MATLLGTGKLVFAQQIFFIALLVFTMKYSHANPLEEPREVRGGVAISSKAKAISGGWAVVHPIQDVLDDDPPSPPDYRGRVTTFVVQVFELPEFWNIRQVKSVEKKIKQLAAKRGHTIVAGGMLSGSVAKRPLAYLNAWFILTQKEGETFLCLLNIDSFQHGKNIDDYEFAPCRIHHIAGKTRKKDLLFVEWSSSRGGKREVYAFQHVAEVPTEDELAGPQLRAQDYQHLIGKSKSDVKKILNTRRRVAGITNNIEFAEYNGMTVHYGLDGIVIKVFPGRHRFDE